MRVFRHIASCALLTVGLAGTLFMSSCSKDSAKWGDKFVGSYNGHETCTTGSDDYTATISATSTPDMTITLQNIYGQGFSATCTKTGDQTFTFSGSQSPATFTGNGTLNGNQLTVVYTISTATVSNSCTFIGNK
ncbi:MAG: hypothetical protein JSS96_07190 [Bacteroidetes bacterium]|nr:hypothetical protein [Bacteroidota bacterium]